MVHPLLSINDIIKESQMFPAPEDTFDLPPETKDNINPSHYTFGGIETIDYIEAKLGVDGAYAFCIGNIIKYVSRAGKKTISTELEDLQKAKWYLEKAMEYAGHD